jgi:predicted transcriptional regulator
VNDSDLIGLTADIVSAHVSHNNVAAADVPTLIRAVHEALGKVGQPVVEVAPAPEPAVSIRASIKPDYLVCLEDGKKLKMLKRYLRTNYNMSPDEYRAKWGLPKDYPMVAPSYRETRSALAHQIGLGRNKPAAPPAPAKKTAPAKAPARKPAKEAPAAKAPAAKAPAAKTGAAPAARKAAKPAKSNAAAVEAPQRKRLGIRTAKAAAKAHLGS